MATWEEVKLAQNPVAFYRCDELVTGDAVDISPTGNNFTLNASALLGLPSPIETDPSSTAIGAAVGLADVVSETELLDNLTLEGWIYYDPDAMSAGTGHLIFRRGQFGSASNCGIGINSHHVTFQLTLTTAVNYELVDPQTLVSGTWYHVAGTRNGANMSLWTNAALADSTNLLTLDQIDYDGNPFWGFGRTVQSGAFQSVGSDELLLFDRPLNGAELLEGYEAAINATLLTGVSNVIPTAIADGTEEPDPTGFAFRHNWADDLIERISFRTGISQAVSGPEEARQARPKPRREIEINQMVRDNSERRALRAKLWANQHVKWFIPILEDRQILTALASGATTIPVSTPFRDYEIGGFVQIRQLNDIGQITQSETLEIATFDVDSVEPLTPVQNDYEGLVEVCPARRGYINVSSLRGHTAEVEDLTITARLLAEDEKAIPNRITVFTPALSYKGYEVFKESLWQSNDWSELREYEVERDISDVDFEAGVFGVESDTPGAQEAFTYRIWIKGRELNASFLGWFYERAGSLNYLWVPSMQRDFEILDVDNALVTVSDTHYSDNYAGAEARRDLAFVYNDGSMALRRIADFDIDGTDEILTLDSNAPTLTNLRSLSLLKFCRLDADMLEIAKRTNDLWIYQWRFRELLESPD